MKRLALGASLAILIAGGALRLPSLATVAQDASDDRLAALETRVAALETRLAPAPPLPSAAARPVPATPTASPLAASPVSLNPIAVVSGPGTAQRPEDDAARSPTAEGAQTITGRVEGGTGTWVAGEEPGACTLLRVAPGAPVEIKDRSGAVLASTSLGPGAFAGAFCQAPFQLTVPEEAIYVVVIAGLGVTTVTRGDLEASGWQLVFSV